MKQSRFTDSQIISILKANETGAKGQLKSEIARRNLNYIEIAKRLEQIGVNETPQNISNKIGRGTFGAIFMLQILEVIGCDEIRLT